MTPPPNHRPTPAESRARNRTALIVAFLPLLMLGLAYASVPLYRMFCQATGFAGTPLRAVEAPSHVLSRTLTVRLDGNVAPGLDWTFTPVERVKVVKIGETAVAHFTATNHASVDTTGSATFNVSPDIIGQYFNKLQCFCFSEQHLKPGETADLAVSFFVDPALDADRDTKGLTTITLSYTFFAVDKPKTGVTAAGSGAGKG